MKAFIKHWLIVVAIGFVIGLFFLPSVIYVWWCNTFQVIEFGAPDDPIFNQGIMR